MQYKHFSVNEREAIQLGLWRGKSVRAIAESLGRSPSSVTREIGKNAPVVRRRYTPRLAHERALFGLCEEVIDSFETPGRCGIGLPLGNLTSQLFVNVYMNEFDRFMKHGIKTKYYLRYADDFVVFSENRGWLAGLIPHMGHFLSERLGLALHPEKVSIRTSASGVDFLGWVHFPDHLVLRTNTKRKAFRRIERVKGDRATVQSYLGLMRHGNTYKVQKEIPKFPCKNRRDGLGCLEISMHFLRQFIVPKKKGLSVSVSTPTLSGLFLYARPEFHPKSNFRQNSAHK